MQTLSTLALASLALGAGAASAADFTIDSTSTTSQTLGPTSGQTGAITAKGSLTVTSGSAITLTGNDATLTNLGTIDATAIGGRAVLDSTGAQGTTITNGSTTNSTALMQANSGQVIALSNAASSGTVNNYGQLIALNNPNIGGSTVDFSSIKTGQNVLNNYAGGLIQSTNVDTVRPGVNGVVYNAGTIKSVTNNGAEVDGVDTAGNSGMQLINDTGGLIEAARHGITGGALTSTALYTASITNNIGATIQGDNGSGINLDGLNANEQVTVVNHGTITGTGLKGDGDGIDVDGVAYITNTGVIKSLNAVGSASEGVTIGGGTVTNSGTIEGDLLPGYSGSSRGITLAGVDTSGPTQGIYANSVITNQTGGVIKGQTDSAIGVDGAPSGFTVTINNQAGGLIVGGGSAAAIRTGADNDTIINSGTIDGTSGGRAIDMGAGNNTLHITGGAATVLGSIDGGIGGTNIMTIDPGAGQGFAYNGTIEDFSSVEVHSGNVTLSGTSTYTGRTLITAGGQLTLQGANRLSSSSALTLDGGTLKLVNAGPATGQTFASLSLTNDSTLDLGASSLTFQALGAITAGKELSVVGWTDTGSPTDYAFRFLGDDTTNSMFLTLLQGTTIDGLAATYTFDGLYTDVSAVPLPAAFPLLLSGLGLLGGAARRRRSNTVS